MKKFLCVIALLATASSYGQGCFEKCRDHLKVSLTEKENLEARFARSAEVLQNLVGCEVPDFTVKTVDGKTISLKDLKGKVLVINFWFKACAPCIAEIPALNNLTETFKDKDVVFIAFSRDVEAVVKKSLIDIPFHYEQVSREYDLSEKYCVISGWPLNMVVGKDGKVAFISSGGRVDEKAKTYAFDQMKPVIDKLLE